MSAVSTIPRVTYRLQLQPSFTLNDASQLLPYLADLGVSHVYCSPYLQAARGSTHGYDVVDHSRVNAELGGPEALARFVDELQRHGLKQILDIVPSHMCIASAENAWWWDVLKNGPCSRFASYFDVDWPPAEEMHNRPILLPILDDHYGNVLDSSRLRIERRGGGFVLRYESTVLPLSPRSIEGVLHTAAEKADSAELGMLADCFATLPHAAATDQRSIESRHRNTTVLEHWLERLCADNETLAATIDGALTATMCDADALDALLNRQNYRVAHWRIAGQELEYRRFFDVCSLASLRTEEERVFQDVHTLVISWVQRGVLDGLRVDHVDGLRDPYHYLLRLREAAPKTWIVVEKILGCDESLPAGWPVDGTTGYEFLNRVTGLLIDPLGEDDLTAIYSEFSGDDAPFPRIALAAKRQVLRELFSADVDRLACKLAAVCRARRRYRDYARHELIEAIVEFAANLGVYRTYVRAVDEFVSPEDEVRIVQAANVARQEHPEYDHALFDLIRDLLLLKLRGDCETDFIMRFQQLTGPAMAKGFEDTALYRYHRLAALNEVGGDPSRFCIPLAQFHEAAKESLARRPITLLASTTHDTKRSEDVRARLALLAEAPAAWKEAIARWSEHNAQYRRGRWPDRGMEYLFYQTLFGAWPIETERVASYMEKSAREAKQYTTWHSPSPEFEDALHGFVTGALGDGVFRDDLDSFVRPFVWPGRVNSLAQTLWKVTAPGVPDIYQGQELWDNSLVDPDNRRRVDFDRRRELLAELPQLSAKDVLSRSEEGLPKLWLLRRALAVRKAWPEAFGPVGYYVPLEAAGERADHLVAYVRGGQILSVAPRWPLRLRGEWGNTSLALPTGKWQNILADESWSGVTRAAELLKCFPVALLVRDDGPPAQNTASR